jgi:hypothetical protein
MQNIMSTLSKSTGARVGVRGLAALLLIFVGADHYYEYSVDHYSVLPTIGTLFLLNFFSASAIGVALLAPLSRALLFAITCGPGRPALSRNAVVTDLRLHAADPSGSLAGGAGGAGRLRRTPRIGALAVWSRHTR